MDRPSVGVENFERFVLDPIVDRISDYSEMSALERRFLNGIVRQTKPAKVLEVGVSAGGSSALILNALKDLPEARLYSVDRSTHYYRNPQYKCGFVVSDSFPQFVDRWKLFVGKDVSGYVDEIGGGIDLVLLDTVHVHPWETLNFLTVLPFLKDNAWLVLHDISRYLLPNGSASLACKYLFDHVTSDSKIRPITNDKPYAPHFPNIGALRIGAETHRYISDVFMSLALPWGSRIDAGDLESILSVISLRYPKHLVELFLDAVAAQDVYEDRLKELPMSVKLRMATRIVSPNLYGLLRRGKAKLASPWHRS